MPRSQTSYVEGIGRRKSAIARVRLTPDSKMRFVVNNRELASYFPIQELVTLIESPFKTTELKQAFMVSAHIRGGGQTAQAEALRHGIARALLLHDISLRKSLKAAGMLRRDARVKERKKFGLRKARRAPQWSKR